ncbi:MAG TPA: outer membrane protein assembly factor BamB [Gammaproteobacteria bacterium]|nr:outer membrane protein assembly factor BamB [Gammaproteobacteria bacterium]
MNSVVSRCLRRNGFLMSLLGASLLLVACGSSPKDYADAAPLASITPRMAFKPLWARATGEVPDYAHTQLPITGDGRGVYVASRQGEVMAFDAQTGKRLWRSDLGEALTGGPGVGEQLLFVATREAELVALDKTTGIERWRQRISSEMLATPVVAGELVVTQTIDGRLAAYRARDGKKRWDYGRSTPKLTLRGTSTPLIVGDSVLAGFADGHLLKLNLITGELLWEATIAVPHGRTELERLVDIDGLFSVADDVVYVSSYQGRVAAVSIADGNILWARDMSSYTGLTVNAQHVFITDASSRVWALDARTGATLWRQDGLARRELTAPAVLGDVVVVADFAGFVHGLSREDGAFVARENLDKAWSELVYVWDDDVLEDVFRTVSVPPRVIDDTLFVRDNLGALLALRLAE